jgi:hypothetical protein
MGANQNSSIEHGICPKSDQRTSLLTQPRPHSYWITIGPRNQVSEPKLLQKQESVQARSQVNLWQQK